MYILFYAGLFSVSLYGEFVIQKEKVANILWFEYSTDTYEHVRNWQFLRSVKFDT